MRSILKHHAIAFVVAMAALPQANAAVSACQTITGGGVSIEECPTSAGGSYSITNNSQAAILSFAVSTLGDSSASARSARAYWFGSYLSEAEWNTQFALNAPSMQFDNLFGTTDTGAFLFQAARDFREGGPAPTTVPILVGEVTGAQFEFVNAVPASEFVVFNAKAPDINAILAQSLPVPEPSTWAMALLGLAVVVRLARRSGC